VGLEGAREDLVQMKTFAFLIGLLAAFPVLAKEIDMPTMDASGKCEKFILKSGNERADLTDFCFDKLLFSHSYAIHRAYFSFFVGKGKDAKVFMFSTTDNSSVYVDENVTISAVDLMSSGKLGGHPQKLKAVGHCEFDLASEDTHYVRCDAFLVGGDRYTAEFKINKMSKEETP
jgi:hypothetical protein